MKTDKLWINSAVRRNDEAAEILREFGRKAKITGKELLYMGLLTEETLGMAAHSLERFDGEIWVETVPKGYEIILEADVRENGAEPSAPPAAGAGFMDRIAWMLNCSYMFEKASEMPESLAALLPDYMSYGAPVRGEAPAWAGTWALSACRRNLAERRKSDPGTGEWLKELEKSIVASLADEVTIGIHGNKIRLAIRRNLRG